jgi:RHH-type rel operon transcriptional repressor/antitoxin RelB
VLTVRMDPELERALETAAREAGLTKSEFVRRGLHDAIPRAKKRSKPTPWDLGRDLFGTVSSGKVNLWQTRARDLIVTRRSAKTAR